MVNHEDLCDYGAGLELVFNGVLAYSTSGVTQFHTLSVYKHSLKAALVPKPHVPQSKQPLIAKLFQVFSGSEGTQVSSGIGIPLPLAGSQSGLVYTVTENRACKLPLCCT